MPTTLILVNGLPGSGKSTLAAQLGDVLAVPVLSKDAIKEAVADALNWPVELSGALGAGCVNPTWPHQDGGKWLHLTVPAIALPAA